MVGDRTNMTSDILIAKRVKEDATVFQVRFSRCRRLLYFIATRILGGSERAEDAIENCWLTASRNPPPFEHESAFRSWLLRVLIDEALAILNEHRSAKGGAGLMAESGQVGIRPRRDFFAARNQLQKQNVAAESRHRRRILKNV